MIISPIVPNIVDKLSDLRVVLFGMKPGIPLHEFVIAIAVIIAVSVFFYFRWKGKAGE